ncbi:MAG: HAD family phosphatase [Candidatus Paceibacterota bacterium]
MPETTFLPKAILWDIEGIFVDTETLHFEAWQWLMEHEQVSPLDVQEYRPCIGRGSSENIQTIAEIRNIRGDLDNLRWLRRQKFEELRHCGIPVISENVRLLRDFVSTFPLVRHIAVSSATRSDIEENLKIAGINQFFELTVSYQDKQGMRRKPAPDMYRYALERARLDPRDCLAFEDTHSGVIAASNARIIVIALPTHLTEGQDFSVANFVVPAGGEKSASGILHALRKHAYEEK